MRHPEHISPKYKLVKKKKKGWEHFCVEGRKLKTTSVGCKESKPPDFLLKGAGNRKGKKRDRGQTGR